MLFFQVPIYFWVPICLFTWSIALILAQYQDQNLPRLFENLVDLMNDSPTEEPVRLRGAVPIGRRIPDGVVHLRGIIQTGARSPAEDEAHRMSDDLGMTEMAGRG